MTLTVEQLVQESYETAADKGWWQNERPFLECLMLAVSELSEACEEYRVHGLNPDKFLYHPPTQYEEASLKPEGIASELADTVIRIADLCGRHNIPLEQALVEKMAFNKLRSHRHGQKLA